MSTNFNAGDREPTGPYEVGYKRPPQHTQFPKGRSGNPRGRPKQPSDFKDVLLRILNKHHVGLENGKRRRMTTFELGLTKLVNKAAMGDRLAWRDLITIMDRFGIKLSTAGGGGLTFIIED